MKLLSLVLLLFIIDTEAKSQVYTSRKVAVHFFSPAPITDIDALTNTASAILNPKKREVKVSIPIASFSFKKALMQQHFNQIYLESDKYPLASFKGIYPTAINLSKDGIYQVPLTGKFSIHGVEKTVTIPCDLSIKNGEIAFNTDFKLLSKDYKISPPVILTKEVGQEISVTVNGVLQKL